jgi:hypothetical protein
VSHVTPLLARISAFAAQLTQAGLQNACASPFRLGNDSRKQAHRLFVGNRKPIESCTILTTTPNSLFADIHDRMPVILNPDDYTLWLDRFYGTWFLPGRCGPNLGEHLGYRGKRLDVPELS